MRREAARSLCRIGGRGAVEILVAHVREQIIPGHLPLDIEGADVVRYAMDGVLEGGNESDVDFLHDVFNEPSMAIHDLRQRAAIGLCLMNDSRCMTPENSSQMPSLIQAAISPMAFESKDPLRGYLVRVTRWLNQCYGTELKVPEGEPSHLERVHLSRKMVLWARENQVKVTD